MKNLSKIFIAFLLFQITSLAQAPDTLWTKTFGGIGYDEGNVIIETNDNGFVVAGGINGPPTYGWPDSSYIIRLNHNGDTLWTRTTLWSSGPYINHPEFVIPNLYELNSGNYVMGFYGTRSGLLWLSSNGDSAQYQIHFSASRMGPWMSHLCKTHDGNYILSYNWGGAAWGGGIKKVDSLGNEMWNQDRGFYVQYVIQTNDSGYATSTGNLTLEKSNIYGDTVWTRHYQDTIAVWGVCLEQISDGGYMILANDENNNLRLLRTNEMGDSLWTKTYGGSGLDFGEYFKQTPDGGYIIVGSTESFGAGGSDVWLIKIDSLENTQWTKTIGGAEDDYGKYVQVTSDGGYIVTGSTYSYGQGDSDIWVIKLAPDPILGVSEVTPPTAFSLSQNYPNPFNPSTTIHYQIPELSFVTLKVYDVLGNEIAILVNEEKTIGSYQVEFDATTLPSGLYFYRLQTGNFIQTKKMVLMK